MVREHPRALRGFTVVELIVAMSLSAVTLLSGYELFAALKRAGDIQSADLAATTLIVRGLDRIREDLLHAVPRIGSREPIFVGASPDPDKSADEMTVLEFYSLCAGQGGDRCRSLRQMCRIKYELVKTRDFVCLYRSCALVVGPGSTPGNEGREQILDRIQRIRIAFQNGQSSALHFSSDERLPVGVELMVTAYGQAWPLSVRLPCGVSEAQP